MPPAHVALNIDASSIDLVVVPALNLGGVRWLTPGRAAPAGGDEPIAGGKGDDDEKRGPNGWLVAIGRALLD